MRDANGNILQVGKIVTVTRPLGALGLVGLVGKIVRIGTKKVHVLIHTALSLPDDSIKPKVLDPSEVILGIHKISSPAQDKLENIFEEGMVNILLKLLSEAVKNKIITPREKLALLDLYDEQEWI